MTEAAKWYVVHTYSGYENTVKATIEKTIETRHLEDLIHIVSIPMETVTEITDNGPKTYDRKVFPGYVLIKMIMSDEAWYIVKNVRGVTGFVIVKAQIDDLRIRFQHLHHREWGRAAAGNVAMFLPLMQVHGDIRKHINGRFKNIKTPVRAVVMKTVTRIAGLDVQTKGFSEAVRAAQMRVAWAVSFVRADEHGVVMRRVFVEQFPAGEIRNHVGIQPARFEKIRKDTVHIRVRNGRRKGLLIDRFLLFCLRINRLHALAQQHGHRFNVTLAVIFLYKADSAAALI